MRIVRHSLSLVVALALALVAMSAAAQDGVINAPGPEALRFTGVTPCRVVDTRNPNGTFGGPAIQGGTSRSFPLPQNSNCHLPLGSTAYALNVTVVPHEPLGFLTIWPTGQPQPGVSLMNSDGRIKANAAIVLSGTGGAAVSVYASNTTDVVIDVNGYFTPVNSSNLQFYPLPPCRVVDTRGAMGLLGGPSLQANMERDFPLFQARSCNIPPSAQAYSLNMTAVPHGVLGYLTVWPAGQQRPIVSTLNAPTGAYTANAAIVRSGSGGDIAVYPSHDTDLVVDINGYFAPAGTGGLSLYGLTNGCRVLDTRQTGGAFNGELTVDVMGSSCTVPGTAQAYVLNATALPQTILGYLTLWPDGQQQPVVSTLNAIDGATTSNMAIVSTTNGSIDAFVTNPSNLILDLSGYLAP